MLRIPFRFAPFVGDSAVRIPRCRRLCFVLYGWVIYLVEISLIVCPAARGCRLAKNAVRCSG